MATMRTYLETECVPLRRKRIASLVVWNSTHAKNISSDLQEALETQAHVKLGNGRQFFKVTGDGGEGWKFANINKTEYDEMYRKCVPVLID
ncbi:hypothetical protein COOONC_23861 [Cooperia oncophora]